MQMVCAQVSNTVGSIGNSPLSQLGLGELLPEGSTRQQAMGEAGSSLANGEDANLLNPAQLYYNRQVNLEGILRVGYKWARSTQGSLRSGQFTPVDLSLVLPVARPLTLAVSLRQYSATDYTIQSEGNVQNALTEKYSNFYTGGGSISQLNLGAGLRLAEGLTLGAQGNYWFGTLRRYSDVSVQEAAVTRELSSRIVGLQGKVGAAYRFKVGSHWASIGLTGEIPTTLSSENAVVFRRYNAQGTLINLDTLSESGTVQMEAPRSIRLGLGWEKPRSYAFGLDLVQEYWQKVRPSGTTTPLQDAYRIGLGAEWMPNYNGQSYFSLMQYRAGLYARQMPFELDGKRMNDIGLSVGLGWPILRKEARYTRPLINSNISVGQRSGATATGAYRELYVNFTLGLVLNDSQWFTRYKID